jgi:isopenicillin N synthase-like dioxygenase
MGGEVLSAGKDAETSGESKPRLSDLKESFSLGPSNPASGMAPRIFPTQPLHFEQAYTAYYTAMEGLASKILQAFAIDLDLDENFFESFTDRHASAIRALNYPVMSQEYCEKGNVRASAHTDYGTVTILKAGGPGLQAAKDSNPPRWVDVPYLEDAYAINLGDLMRRWTNNQWQSTLHRVVNPPVCDAWQRRQSIAFFQNVNRDALVSALPGTGEPLFEPIIAGDFLMKKHLAATSGNLGYVG